MRWMQAAPAYRSPSNGVVGEGCINIIDTVQHLKQNLLVPLLAEHVN